MVIRTLSHIIGTFLIYLSLALLIPLIAATYFQFITPDLHPQPHSTIAFLWTFLISSTLAISLRFFGRKQTAQLYRREGIFLVMLIWIVTALISALPFYLSKTLSNPLDAYFEAMSGITTTGASIIAPKAYDPQTGEEIPIYVTNLQVPNKTYTYWGNTPPVRDPTTGLILYSGVEAVGKALLLWRSFLQWIGGMGIVLIFLTVLPALGVGGKFLYQMEMTGPIKDEISPRIRDTASQLWKLYLFFTVTELGLLMWTNNAMPFFDALCISLSNVSTGGFSVRNNSIASYNSFATETIVLIFMLVGSINFSLYFQAIRMKFFKVYVPDFSLFLFSALGGGLLVSWFLIDYQPLGEAIPFTIQQAFRNGFFQALSMQTSTGFFISNYDFWPFASQMFMLLLMFLGGMSGSTAGGIKTPRFYILYKLILHRLESIYRPDTVRKLRIGTRDIDDQNALTVLSFFAIAIFCTILGTVILILNDIDPETALGLIACFINNTGTAFRAAGPLDSFAFLDPFSKLLATLWMLLGRLEYFIVILLFLPSFWKNR